MDVFIGSSDTSSYEQALSWLSGSPESRRLFDQVSNWLTSQEREWGPAALFAEVDVPGNGLLPTEQTDLLLAFGDRALVCELKLNRQRIDVQSVDKSLNQLNRKLRLVKKHLHHIAPDRATSGVLLYPFLSAADIVALRKDANQHAFSHLTIAGGLQCIDHQAPAGDRPYAFLEATERCFRFADREVTVRQPAGVRVRLISKIAWLPSVRRSRSLPEALEDLKRITGRQRSVLLAPTHVEGLRDPMRELLATGLATHGCIEVTGPAGIGKSALIREALAREEERSGRALTVIPRDRVVADVFELARGLLESTGHDPELSPDDEQVLARLVAVDAIVWFRKAIPPAASPVQLAHRVASAPGRRLRLIIESPTPLLPAPLSLLIRPLSPGDIYKILMAQPASGHAEPDVNRISRQAQGNPSLAIAYWRSRAADTGPDRTGAFQWVTYCFDPFEKTILRFVVLFLKDAPLGLTPSLLSSVACNIYKNEIPMRVREAVDTVLAQLEAAQLIHVDRLSRDFVHTAVGAVLDDFVTINNVDGSLVDFVARSLTAVEADNLAGRITAELIDHHSTTIGSLAEVTASLRTGELWPFCRSVFRYTHRGGILAWLDQMATHRLSSAQRSHTDLYLERAIRLQQRMFQYPQEPVNVRAVLGEPNPAEPQQQYMWDALQGRQNCFLFNGRCDLDEWRRTAERLADGNLAGQAKASLARGLQISGDVAGAWQLLSSLYEELDTYDKPTRGIIHFHILSFLNRRKSAEQLPQFRKKDELAEHVRRYSSEALQLALELENVTFVASTVFYLTKALETADPPRNHQSLAAYLAALRFVEHASPIRALQSILSQGSFHRHYVFRSPVSLTWQEFVHHIDESFQCNQRAFNTAVNSRSTVHQLNATSYCGELSLGSLSRVDSDEAHAYLRRRVQTTADMYRYVLTHYKSDEDITAEALHIYWTIKHTSPLIDYVRLFYDAAPLNDRAWTECGGALKREWDSRVKCIRTLRYQDRAKAYSELLRNASKVHRFFGQCQSRLEMFKRSAAPAIAAVSRAAKQFIAQDRFGEANAWMKKLRANIRTVDALFS